MVRTRELLIDVARQLFARQGVAATTMNDIAEASGKGRRTIYTYFKNKNEIYWAVVEAESKHLYARLEGLTNRDLPPEEKLLNYINIRLEAVEQGVFHIPNVTATASVLHYALRGLDVPYIRNNFSESGIDRSRLKDYILDFILYGIKR